ncbi:ATP-dependent RNA helicase dbp8, partial [Striga asiatica]
GIQVDASIEKTIETPDKCATDKAVNETVVKAFRTKSEALQKRAADKVDANVAITKAETLKKSAPNKAVHEKVVQATRTKSEALQKRAADKHICAPAQNVVTSPADEFDDFSLFNTQFYAEVDKSAQALINSAPKQPDPVKNQSDPLVDKKDAESGKRMKTTDPASTAVIVFRETGSNPDKPAMLDMEQKRDSSTSLKKTLQRSCPFDGKFWNMSEAHVEASGFNDWMMKGFFGGDGKLVT